MKYRIMAEGIAVAMELRNYGYTEIRRDGYTEARKYGLTEKRKYGGTERAAEKL